MVAGTGIAAVGLGEGAGCCQLGVAMAVAVGRGANRCGALGCIGNIWIGEPPIIGGQGPPGAQPAPEE